MSAGSHTARPAATADGCPALAEQFSALLADVCDCAIGLVARDGAILTWNSGAEVTFGYSAEEIVGKPFAKLFRAEDAAQGLPGQHLERAILEGRMSIDGWRARRDESPFWASTALTRLQHADGACRGVVAIVRDLERRRLREEALRASEERFRLLVDGVRDYAIFALDRDGHVMSWNDGARHIKGYEPHEIIGCHFSRFYPLEAIERQWPEYELLMATTEGRFEDEGWRIRKDGSRFWANVVITAQRDSKGTLLGFSKITRDLSERRKQEEELRQSEERCRLLMELVTDHAIFLLDANGMISSWTTGSEQVFGYRAEEIMWKHVSNLYREEDTLANNPWYDLTAAREHGGLIAEAWRRHKNGRPFWARVTITVLTNDEAQPYGYAQVIRSLEDASASLENAAHRSKE
jgi:PAS domain S-box-containing protein